jgi:NADH-quinone oxidoreductase subunit M
MFGELDNPKNQKLLDLNGREIAIMVPLVVMIFVMGLYPKPFIDKMDPAIKKLVAQARITPVNAQMIPAQMPAGHQGVQQMPGAEQGQDQMPAGHQGGAQMPAGHSGMDTSASPNTSPAVNPHDAK